MTRGYFIQTLHCPVAALWRIVLPQDNTPIDEAVVQMGLERHLARDDLTTTLVRIDETQRAYVWLRGCGRCVTGRCLPGCRVTLLQRVLHAASLSAARLEPVALGLHPRPYTRTVLAWPTPSAQPLTGAFLHRWPEGHLSVLWRTRAVGRQLVAVAQLHLGAAGPDPAPLLEALGWRAHLVPQRLQSVVRSLPLGTWLFAGQTMRAPFLLLPQPHEMLSEQADALAVVPDG